MLLPWSGDHTGAHGKDGQSPNLLGDEFCYTVLKAALLGLQSLTKLLLSSFSLSDPGASPYLVLRTVFRSLFLKCFYQIILSGLTFQRTCWILCRTGPQSHPVLITGSVYTGCFRSLWSSGQECREGDWRPGSGGCARFGDSFQGRQALPGPPEQ